MTDHKVSPEWLVPTRVDFEFDEALKGGWGVSPAPLMRGASFTDFGTHEMAVPLGDSPEEKAVRLHELIHARISPTQVPPELMKQLGVSSMAVRLAEEVRVNFVGRDVATMVNRANKAGRQLSETLGDTFDLCDGTEKEVARKAVEKDSWNDALHIFLSTYNTGVYKTVKRTLRKKPEWREPLEVIETSLDERHRFCHRGETFAGSSTRSGIYANDTTPINYVWKDPKGNEQSTIIPQGFIHHTLVLANDIDHWLVHPPQKGRRRKSVVTPNEIEANTNASAWETLSFGLTSLTETTSAFLGRRKRPAMTGKYPTRPDRLLTDPERRIFRETVRAQGGIVVFDCSGSMGVHHDVVAHAVKQFAGATIVVYSSSRASRANAWVVARNGRMVSREEFDELPLNQGNGVDGPILRWAIRQRKQREFIMWVSDGQVTGKGDNQTEAMKVECAYLSTRHNIIGVNDCGEALQLLSDLKKGMPLPRQKFCRLMSHYVGQLVKYGTISRLEEE